MTIVFNANLFPSRKKLMIKAGMDIDSEITSTDRFNKELSVIDKPVIPPGVKAYSMKKNLTAKAVKKADNKIQVISLIEILNIILGCIS